MVFNLLMVGFGLLGMQCHSTPQRADDGPFWGRVRQQLRKVEPYVVGVGAAFRYRVEDFELHEVRDTTIESYGAGLLLYRRDGRGVALTTRHLLVSEETVFTYRRAPESLPLRRSILVSSKHFVEDRSPQLRAAEVLCTDARMDLGLIVYDASVSPIDELPYDVLYSRRLDWGEMVFLFGYPRQAKQLTFGVVSPSPYYGNFVVDAATRFGYSGGPIFLFEKADRPYLVGIVRAMAADALEYLTPPPEVPAGDELREDDLRHVRSARKRLIEYGTTLSIEAERIGQFLTHCRAHLVERGIVLDENLLP